MAKRDVNWERWANVLAVFTFVLSCWTLHRTLRPRETCVGSPFIRAVVIRGEHVNNCALESRLRFGGPNLSVADAARLRHLEDTPGFDEWFVRGPRLVVEIDDQHRRAFALTGGHLRLGGAWLDDGAQVKRALAMALLKLRPSFANADQFQIESMADFVVLTTGDAGAHALARDVKFATVTPSLAVYCGSRLRSLAHDGLCRKTDDAEETTWGFRPLLASGLARTFSHLSLAQKLRVIAAVRDGRVSLPSLGSPSDASVDKLVEWFGGTLRRYAGALQMMTEPRSDRALARATRELDVEAPTHWELTVDVRHTPAWRDIVRQLLARAKFRLRERALIFTPEGEVALPSGLPVSWAAADVASQKHVMIACQFPPHAVNVRARQLFARQTCGPLSQTFWD